MMGYDNVQCCYFYFSLSAPKNYKLAMHVFGLLTTARSIVEFDEMLLSSTVIFSSPCSSENVEKHFNNIQTLLTNIGESVVDDSSIVPEDLEVHSKHEKSLEIISSVNLIKITHVDIMSKFIF